MITKGIRVAGVGRPVVAANGLDEGFFVAGRQSAGAVVSGFVVRGANFEGILVETTSRVTISNNAVQGNDQGRKAQKPVGECAPMGQVPGDCGEGVHLMSVTNSRVVGNQVNRNSGGILLTDELGPTAHNLISGNDVSHSPLDCGVTIAGHNSQALGHPKTAGVYGNTIINNVANDVGTKGEGAGILIAAAVPGAAAYDNLVKNNVANDDGLAGVTLHSHTPAQDLNGNVIINNRLKHDGLDAGSEAEFGENGKTVGILVGSGVTKLKGIVIAGNTIQNVHFGIYTKNAPKVNPRANTFKNVKVRIKQV
jgi:parallel beta-helix repeat protein